MSVQLHRHTHETINYLVGTEIVLSGVGDIFHCAGFNNNRFIDSLTAPPYFLRRSGFMPCPILTMLIKTDKPPSEIRGQHCLYDMLCKLFQQCELADKRKLFSLSLCGVDDTHNHKYQSEDTAYCA